MTVWYTIKNIVIHNENNEEFIMVDTKHKESIDGFLYDDVDFESLDEYNIAESARLETKAQYEAIKCLREEAECSLSETREIINSANDTYNLLSKEDGFAQLRLSIADERLSNVYAREIRRYVELLKCEEFLKFVLSTSIFDDCELGYVINDHIKFVLKLERS